MADAASQYNLLPDCYAIVGLLVDCSLFPLRASTLGALYKSSAESSRQRNLIS